MFSIPRTASATYLHISHRLRMVIYPDGGYHYEELIDGPGWVHADGALSDREDAGARILAIQTMERNTRLLAESLYADVAQLQDRLQEVAA